MIEHHCCIAELVVFAGCLEKVKPVFPRVLLDQVCKGGDDQDPGMTHRYGWRVIGVPMQLRATLYGQNAI